MIRSVHGTATRLAIAALFVGGVANSGLAQPRPAPPSKRSSVHRRACRDALLILRAGLRDRASASDVLAPEAPDSPPSAPKNGAPLARNDKHWSLGWTGDRPPRGLIEQWYKTPYHSGADCFGVHSEVALRTILGPSVNDFLPVDGVTAGTIKVSQFSLDGPATRAIFVYSRFSRTSFGGRVEIVYLTRGSDGWKKAGWNLLLQS
jgi:hypothetical protein